MQIQVEVLQVNYNSLLRQVVDFILHQMLIVTEDMPSILMMVLQLPIGVLVVNQNIFLVLHNLVAEMLMTLIGL